MSDAEPALTLLIADDEELTRAGLRTLLSARPGITVVGEAADGVEAVSAAGRLRPDVVLMDVRMPRLDGIEATRRIRAEVADPPRIVIITTFENDEYVWDALVAGADGFIRKRAPSAQIAQAVRLVASGDSLLFPQEVRTLAALRGPAPRPAAAAASLTARERQILALMAEGLSNQQISRRLTVSPETIKTHVGNVLTKLDATNRTHAVVLAYKAGVLSSVPDASRDRFP